MAVNESSGETLAARPARGPVPDARGHREIQCDPALSSAPGRRRHRSRYRRRARDRAGAAFARAARRAGDHGRRQRRVARGDRQCAPPARAARTGDFSAAGGGRVAAAARAPDHPPPRCTATTVWPGSRACATPGAVSCFPASRGPLPAREDAAEAIVAKAREHGDALTIVALGPLTNLARALGTDAPAMLAVGRLIVMGGAIEAPGNVTAAAEFNFHVDPEAADRVLTLRDADHARRARRDPAGVPALARGARCAARQRIASRPRHPPHDAPRRFERRRAVPARSARDGACGRLDTGPHPSAAGPGRDEGRAYPGDVGCRPASGPRRAPSRRNERRERYSARGSRFRSRYPPECWVLSPSASSAPPGRTSVPPTSWLWEAPTPI